MKYNKSVSAFCLMFILSVATLQAQYYYGENINETIIIRSDIPSKSALVSNLLTDSAGDNSPVICAANWKENGRQLECRSLLKFNYDYIPEFILKDPSLIVSAKLVLYPLQLLFSQHDGEKPAKFVVRRIAENWEDSTTCWTDQPAADSSLQASKLIKVKNKNEIVTVDVTKLVLKMLHEGNNGFLISSENPQPESLASGQFFASPKYRFEELRPLLVINYRILNAYWRKNDPVLTGQALINEQQRLIELTKLFNPVTTQGVGSPAPQPVAEPIKTNPVKD